ncbi:hypothetical protein [Nonomuraea jabiensis]|uniref:hypothetical protein n=1 Tax=Nonomuraea jabiensis TaxID=882448 RepID=UPI003D73C28D
MRSVQSCPSRLGGVRPVAFAQATPGPLQNRFAKAAGNRQARTAPITSAAKSSSSAVMSPERAAATKAMSSLRCSALATGVRRATRMRLRALLTSWRTAGSLSSMMSAICR